MINIKENEQLSILNHSCAHVLAQAVKNLYPQAKFWVGPVISEGFYYDIDINGVTITEEDLPKIEKEMKKISKDGKKIVRRELSKQEAYEMFADDPYKIDLLDNMAENENVISCYSQGDFIDLCRGPHVDNVKMIKHFKLLKTSGAYWKGDANNKMLQRIYGICFETQEELDHHLDMIEEAKKRDHRKLGKEMDLFMLSDFGPGLPFWLPDGFALRRILEDFWLDLHRENDYFVIDTPIMLSQKLWETSGHWEHYKEDMFIIEADEGTYAIKPMNCPGAILVYNNTLHSYRELPLRYAELGHVHRNEASGALTGLFRVRGFTQDDAHIMLMESQIEEEVARILDIYDQIYSVFGLNYAIELSTRPEEGFIGEIEVWDKAEKALEKACLKTGRQFKINPGDGAFYGPKLDFKLTDSLGRIWQCGTVQLDMQLPGRFNCQYVAEDGSKKTPVMIHRACFGSLERFIGIILENYAGVFPLWLAPKQFTVIPVNPLVHGQYAKKLTEKLTAEGFRVICDDRNEKLGYRIREAQIKKNPIQIVIGDAELENKTVTIRRHGDKKSVTLSLEQFIKDMKHEIQTKGLE
ncbi:MAG TPA: threonine--tRNA ligase [Erysipelotrichaceae bacterium]|nr:threonine--tRNA ligase [Erysipelotrichia bacterium]HPX32125.1 threonine--tRNA ligase [Erysipelotrichaceae bacterium]HQA84542.1 threonine--tRNA ligase [Erysipelotrichaceae bacterium]